MISVKAFKIFVTGASCAILFASLALGISTGEKAPYFKVTSGEGVILTGDMLNGKIAVIFYETKDTKEKNRALKNELNTFYANQPPATQKDIARIAIIRCSTFLPSVWRRGLRENSEKEGITIYGDWDGPMGKTYGMAANESNFFIIDKSGIVRYIRAGVIPEKDFPAIEEILNSLK